MLLGQGRLNSGGRLPFERVPVRALPIIATLLAGDATAAAGAGANHAPTSGAFATVPGTAWTLATTLERDPVL